MSDNIIEFPKNVDFDKEAERALAPHLVRVYDEHGRTGASNFINSLVWLLAKCSADTDGAEETRKLFEMAGTHGYDKSEVQP